MTQRSRGASSRLPEWAAGVAALAAAVFLIVRLVAQAAVARLQSDECYHAWMAEWIATHWSLPPRVEGLYSGFPSFYPPLLHIAGAVMVSLFGAGALPLLGVVVQAALLATLAVVVARQRSPRAARWAVFLIIANTWLSFFAVVFYAEALSTLITVAFLLALLWLRDDPRARRAVVVGVLAGLALLTKQSALALVGLLLLLAGFYALRRRGPLARALLLAAGVGVLLALPLYTRNWVLYGSPIYPALAPDAHPLLLALNQARFTPPPGRFYLANAVHVGPLMGAFVVMAFVATVLRRRWTLEAGLMALGIAAFALGPLQPMLDPRHLNPAIAWLAVLSAIIVSEWLGARGRIAWAVEPVLLLVALVTVVRLPYLRYAVDPQPEFARAYEAVQEHVPLEATVLSLWTYDTFYHAHRKATWPIPWGQKRPPIEMFLTSDCDSVVGWLDRHGIEFVLTTRLTGDSLFTGTGYPADFIRCEGELARDGRLGLVWTSDRLALLRRRRPPGATTTSP